MPRRLSRCLCALSLTAAACTTSEEADGPTTSASTTASTVASTRQVGNPTTPPGTATTSPKADSTLPRIETPSSGDPLVLDDARRYEGVGWAMMVDPTWEAVSELDVPSVAAWTLTGDDVSRVVVERHQFPDLASFAAAPLTDTYYGFSEVSPIDSVIENAASPNEQLRLVASGNFQGTVVGVRTVAVAVDGQVFAARYIAPVDTFEGNVGDISLLLVTLEPE